MADVFDAPEIVDKIGEVRRLGTIPVPSGFTTTFASYAEAGRPMWTKAELINIAKSRNTRGSAKFDSSWILNQRSKGSCNGHAAASGTAKSRVRRGLKKVLLSGAYAYSLMNGGRDNGSTLSDGMAVIQERGIATLDTVQWNQIYPRDYDKAKADAEAARFRADECYVLTTEMELFSALAADFDVIFAVHVGNSFMHVNSSGVAGSDRGMGNHSVSGDGYWVERDQLVADGVNSWDVTYGVQGRMGLTWDQHFAGTVQYHGFYAIRTAIDDPKDENPPAIKS